MLLFIRMLSKRDVEVVVENGKPFLFRTGPDSLKRLSLYLRSGRQGIGKVSSIFWQKLSPIYWWDGEFSSRSEKLVSRLCLNFVQW